MLTLKQINQILALVKFQDWRFEVSKRGNGFLLNVAFTAPEGLQKGRKWYISPYSTRSEVVQTVLKAVLTALEHEAREQFLYDGEAIFGPHFDIETLFSFSCSKRLDKRA